MVAHPKEPKPWSTVHELHVYNQTEQRPADSGWIESQSTGRVHLLCNCGYSSGWITREEMPSQGQLAIEHGVPFRSVFT